MTATILFESHSNWRCHQPGQSCGAGFEFDVIDNAILRSHKSRSTRSFLTTPPQLVQVPREPIDLFLTVMNNGTNPAPNVVLTDRLPDTVNFISANATQGTCTNQNGGIVNCDLGLLDAGASVVAIVTVGPSVTGAITNTATVTSDMIDPNLADNIFSVVSLVSSGGFFVTKQQRQIPCSLTATSFIRSP
jgi:uncharacterized repeat protein (TIGR01451 family)